MRAPVPPAYRRAGMILPGERPRTHSTKVDFSNNDSVSLHKYRADAKPMCNIVT